MNPPPASSLSAGPSSQAAAGISSASSSVNVPTDSASATRRASLRPRDTAAVQAPPSGSTHQLPPQPTRASGPGTSGSSSSTPAGPSRTSGNNGPAAPAPVRPAHRHHNSSSDSSLSELGSDGQSEYIHSIALANNAPAAIVTVATTPNTVQASLKRARRDECVQFSVEVEKPNKKVKMTMSA